jgi:xylose isomerase
MTLEECEAFVMAKGEPKQQSGQQEKYETIMNMYV